MEDTSPARLTDHGEDTIIDNRYGAAIPGREGEVWFLDEFGGFGKVGLFGAPTAALAPGHQTAPLDPHTVTARAYQCYLDHPRPRRPALIAAAAQALAG